ncbi:GlxA family transcriptional regulator [Streptomyces sp. TRM68367]|uniref:GlxA family transcriptional regulator n=1 Tax=Streptomyces sp. TRM68367 TaxID=2758415 RepID=UPI00165CA85B|nr:GlxA family transcriptional regulator [Streptomyces sp. TRM68367]MBC9727524.1 GlxA family transcriptional regulator [Streptomyces sp. TRM68367]
MAEGIATRASTPRRRIVFLVYDKVTLQDVAAPLEIFARAKDFGADYDVLLASPTGRSVQTTSFVSLNVDVGVDALVGDLDTLIVPGGVPPDTDPQTYAKPEEPTPDAIPAVVDAAGRLVPQAGRIASVCTGAFVLASLGVLDGRRATTHWAHCDELAERFPRVEVAPDALFVQDGPVVTGAGICAGADLALALVEGDYGADLARRVARWLVVFLQRPGGQAQFSVWHRRGSVEDSGVAKAMDDVILDPAGDHSVSAMARRAAMNERRFARLFTQQVGISPVRYVEQTRLEAAKLMLGSGDSGLEAVASSCGFGSAETMRRAFRRSIGVSPADYRERFRTTGMHREGSRPDRTARADEVVPPAGAGLGRGRRERRGHPRQNGLRHGDHGL